MLRFDAKSKKYLYFCNKFALSKEERAMNVKKIHVQRLRAK